ncbi:hypothetical protein GCM10027589_08600 [Actinocorallia lasiicapitis]
MTFSDGLPAEGQLHPDLVDDLAGLLDTALTAVQRRDLDDPTVLEALHREDANLRIAARSAIRRWGGHPLALVLLDTAAGPMSWHPRCRSAAGVRPQEVRPCSEARRPLSGSGWSPRPRDL